MNRGWIDRSTRRLPTYKEITSSKTKGKGKAKEDQSDVDTASGYDDENRKASESEESDGKPGNEELDEDEFDEIVDRFESSYNFRFEEPYVASDFGLTLARFRIQPYVMFILEELIQLRDIRAISLRWCGDKIPRAKKRVKNARRARRRSF